MRHVEAPLIPKTFCWAQDIPICLTGHLYEHKYPQVAGIFRGGCISYDLLFIRIFGLLP